MLFQPIAAEEVAKAVGRVAVPVAVAVARLGEIRFEEWLEQSLVPVR